MRAMLWKHSVPNAGMLKQGQTPAWAENLRGLTRFPRHRRACSESELTSR